MRLALTGCPDERLFWERRLARAEERAGASRDAHAYTVAHWMATGTAPKRKS